MESYKGLVFVKQGRIGSRSEGPDYYLQTKEGEYLLERKTVHEGFRPDYFLEFYCRKFVAIDGKADGKHLVVTSIHETGAGRLE